MFPQFPRFKTLEINDRNLIKKYTKDFEPYSDFDFTSLWCWDIRKQTKLSELNGNLVVKFSDYITFEPFLSFIGVNRVNETCHQLIDYARTLEMPQILKLLPEEIACKINDQSLCVTPDRDHFDYIYNVHELASFNGSKFHKKRSDIKRFIRDHHCLRVQSLDLRSRKMLIDTMKVNYRWLGHKNLRNPYQSIANEPQAIERFWKYLPGNYFSIGIYSEEELIAYSVSERVNKHFAVGHFYKAAMFSGLFDLLVKESAALLKAQQIKYLNFEQDLGFSGLRQSKASFQPFRYLRKYTVSSH